MSEVLVSAPSSTSSTLILFRFIPPSWVVVVVVVVTTLQPLVPPTLVALSLRLRRLLPRVPMRGLMVPLGLPLAWLLLPEELNELARLLPLLLLPRRGRARGGGGGLAVP